MTAGLTALYSNINDNTLSPIEPRLGFNYDVDKHNKFFTGAGYHSQMQSSYLYYYRVLKRHLKPLPMGYMELNTTRDGTHKECAPCCGWEHNFDYQYELN